jgi:predicted O-methyltransferase YrrM
LDTVRGVDNELLELARRTPGFMPEAEGRALYEAGLEVAAAGPMLEIGSYCGLSALYLGAAARARDGILFSVDHHRGSEEHQPGEEYHDPSLTDGAGGIDTLPCFRRTLRAAGLEDCVVPVVGESSRLARHWRTPLSLVFIDGGHSQAAADSDYAGWAPWVIAGGRLVIHDVFSDPVAGGRAPFEVYRRALKERFEEVSMCGSLRVLRRPSPAIEPGRRP